MSLLLLFQKGKGKILKVDLNKFGIKNDGTAPVQTANGINNALQYAKQYGFFSVIMPPGLYCISETIPIVMVDNVSFNLNQSTFKINPNGLLNSTMINFTACRNSKLINGILLGDKDQHDYSASGTHEGNVLVAFNDCENCCIDNITVRNSTGYGIYSTLGKNISDLVIGVTYKNLSYGSISEEGILKNDGKNVSIRTIDPINISGVGGEYELGYNKGYMGYPYMEAKTFDAFYYDKNMNFLSSTISISQYKKTSVPYNAVYVHFVFHQNSLPSEGDTDYNGTTVFITNYMSPNNIRITNCLIDNDRCLGASICGGRNFLFSNNTFSNCGGAAANYAIDLEDGWEYMGSFTFSNNIFTNNNNDVVVCAGDNITFENNYFTNTVYVWPRTTNYKFIRNTFKNISLSINYAYSTDTLCTENIYINCSLYTEKHGTDNKITIDNESLINSSVEAMSAGDVITNSSITGDGSNSPKLSGNYDNCYLNCVNGYYSGCSFNGCNIQNVGFRWQGDVQFKSCEFTNSFSSSHSTNGTVTAYNCNFINSGFILNTWGPLCVLDIENSNIIMSEGTDSFVEITAGKMKNLIFTNNTVNDNISEPVFDMYDTQYTLPNGNAVITGSTFTLTNYKYVFDGNDVSSGVFYFTDSNNSITGAAMLNPKYKNNKYFIIK